MGLCKCPQKKVTNQYCFEHRVTVCEHCMVSNHSKCIVRSYLQWLQDGDYDPTCQLCKTDLADGDCTRLICYHIFHWTCLDKYACEFPPHTAPAGYTCPTCNTGIFPPANIISPVADTLRTALIGVNWARAGLGHPLIEEIPSEQISQIVNVEKMSPHRSLNPSPDINRQGTESSNTVSLGHSHNVDINSSSSSNRPEPYGASFSTAHFSSPRKMYDATDHGNYRPTLVDHDDDKYKRRSALEWFNRWFKSRTILGGSRRKDPHVFYKRWIVLSVLALIGLCTVIMLFLRLGRASADSDPLLDPHLNPNIRVQDAMEGFPVASVKDVLPDIDRDNNAVPLNGRQKAGLPG